MPFYTANQADKAEAATIGRADRTTSRTSTRRCRRSSSQAIRDYPSSTSRRGCTGRCSSGSPGCSTSAATTGCRTTTSSSSTGTRHADLRSIRDPPQHPRRLQLHDHRRHRRRPAAAGRRAGAVADRRGLGLLRGEQPQLPRQGPDRGLGPAGRRPLRRRGAGRLLRVPRRAAAVHAGQPRARDLRRRDREPVLDDSGAEVLFSARGELDEATDVRPGRQRARWPTCSRRRASTSPADRLAAQRGRGQAGHGLVHDHVAGAAGDGAGATRSTAATISGLPIQQGTLSGAQHRSGARMRLAERAGLARGRPRPADAARRRRRSCTSTTNKQLRRGRATRTASPSVVQRCSTSSGAGWVDVPGQAREPGEPGAELQHASAFPAVEARRGSACW